MLNLSELKSRISKFELNWEAGETSLSNDSDFLDSKRFGLKIRKRLLLKTAMKKALNEDTGKANYPNKFDWRNHKSYNWTTSIKDQDECGSCVAFAIIGAWETKIKIESKKPNMDVDLSEAYLFFCSDNYHDCDTGWFFEDALTFAQTGGTVDEICFPYNINIQTCRKCRDYMNQLIKIQSWKYYTKPSFQKEEIAKSGPIIAGIDVYEDFMYYKSGVYKHIMGDESEKHAIVIVGYNDEDRYWICKNSWGDDWGDNGWFKIAYGECNIDNYKKYFIKV